jgi:hypothetical protein
MFFHTLIECLLQGFAHKESRGTAAAAPCCPTEITTLPKRMKTKSNNSTLLFFFFSVSFGVRRICGASARWGYGVRLLEKKWRKKLTHTHTCTPTPTDVIFDEWLSRCPVTTFGLYDVGG